MSCRCIGQLISRDCPEHRSIYKMRKEIERLEMELMACGDARGIEGMIYEKEIERLRAALERIRNMPNGRGLHPAAQEAIKLCAHIADVALQEGES